MATPALAAAPNDAYPYVAEIDGGRLPHLLVRVIRLHTRHDRLIVTLTRDHLTVALNWEGDDLGVVRHVVGVLPLGPEARAPGRPED